MKALLIAAIAVSIGTLGWFVGGVVAWPHAPVAPLWYTIPLGVGIVVSFTALGAAAIAAIAHSS
jgi:hypothetical protein